MIKKFKNWILSILTDKKGQALVDYPLTTVLFTFTIFLTVMVLKHLFL
jgi:hypothetical protein